MSTTDIRCQSSAILSAQKASSIPRSSKSLILNLIFAPSVKFKTQIRTIREPFKKFFCTGFCVFFILGFNESCKVPILPTTALQLKKRRSSATAKMFAPTDTPHIDFKSKFPPVAVASLECFFIFSSPMSDFWTACLEQIKNDTPRDVFQTWFADLTADVELEAGSITIWPLRAPNFVPCATLTAPPSLSM